MITVKRGLIALGASAAFGAVIGEAVRRAVPPVGEIHDIKGQGVHVYDRGEGPAVAMIHGLSGQLNNFYGMWPMLPGCRVIAHDRAGAGYTEAGPLGANRIAAQAKLAALVLERAQAGPATVVGHSLGGAVALRLALDRPDLVRNLVLLAPLTRWIPDLTPAWAKHLNRRRWATELVAHTVGDLTLAAAAWPLIRTVFDPEDMPLDAMTRGGFLLTAQPKSQAAVGRDTAWLVEDMDRLELDLPDLSQPVTALFGTGDRVLDYRHHGVGFARRVPHAKLRLLNSGHMLPISRPATCAQAILETIQSVG